MEHPTPTRPDPNQPLPPDLLYGLDDRPPWGRTLLYGLQYVLGDFTCDDTVKKYDVSAQK